MLPVPLSHHLCARPPLCSRTNPLQTPYGATKHNVFCGPCGRPTPSIPDPMLAGQGEADVNQNNGSPSEKTAATDSTGAGGPKNAWSDASAADPNAARPHLVRLFSRDAPGRQDNTFKDRPSESDELHTIQEHGGTGTESGSDLTEQDED
ncbi:hypothetical protein JZ751_015646 [Albula glossodonta]|uniref:Myelin basic protein n=1 Tax=Albula glossodonta TaxID=121402 RepID=A0A8T2NU70_9TELE|nr:hypothetical protein JZ751_015646 [Albula glossodonta]